MPWINTNQFGPLGRYSTQFPIWVPDAPPTPPQAGQKFQSLVPGAQPTPAAWLNGVAGNNQVFTGVTLPDTAFAPTWTQSDNIIFGLSTDESESLSVSAQNPNSLPLSIACLSTAQYGNHAATGLLGTASYLDFFINNSVAVSVPIVCSASLDEPETYAPLETFSSIGGFLPNRALVGENVYPAGVYQMPQPDLYLVQNGIPPYLDEQTPPGAPCNFFTPNFFWTSVTLRSEWFNADPSFNTIGYDGFFANSIVLSSLRGGLFT